MAESGTEKRKVRMRDGALESGGNEGRRPGSGIRVPAVESRVLFKRATENGSRSRTLDSMRRRKNEV